MPPPETPRGQPSDPALPPSATAALEALRAGRTSAEALARVALARIARENPHLGAFTAVLEARARADARAADAAPVTPALAGLPVAVKDLIDTTPAVCPGGLPFLSTYRPARDALAVRRLRAAGAVILGVTASDPGGFGVRTAAVRHPHAPERTVGGSSGGSAAALAAGLCLAALGTDTGGSVRIPAACCLVAGFKPSFGRVPVRGVRPLATSLDHVGPMARRVADLAALQAVLDPGFGRTRRRAALAGACVGVDPGYFADADPEVRAGMDQAREACRALGAAVREVSLPGPDDIAEVHLAVFSAEAAAYHLGVFPDRLAEYPRQARRIIEIGGGQLAWCYLQALEERTRIRRRVDTALHQVDFLLLPTLPVLAPARDAERVLLAGRDTHFTAALIRYVCLFNHTGHPVLSLPVRRVQPGLGVSAQLVGRRGADADVLALGAALERVLALAPP